MYVEGAGTLAGLGNANPCSEEPYDGQTHPTYYGRAQAVIRAGYEAGEIRVKVVCEGCETVEVVITVRENRIQ